MNSNMNSEYPTEEQLLKITAWKYDDLPGLMEYIEPLWMYADSNYWTEAGGKYNISTGGWSGNEDIIEAMQKNYIWWSLYWNNSSRGGHFVFMENGIEILTKAIEYLSAAGTTFSKQERRDEIL